MSESRATRRWRIADQDNESAAALGEALGLSEDEIIARVRDLKAARVIRQIGAIAPRERCSIINNYLSF